MIVIELWTECEKEVTQTAKERDQKLLKADERFDRKLKLKWW